MRVKECSRKRSVNSRRWSMTIPIHKSRPICFAPSRPGAEISFVDCKPSESRRELINPAYTSQTCPNCVYLDKGNRHSDVFQCLKCGHRGHADQIAAINHKSRFFDRRITLYSASASPRPY